MSPEDFLGLNCTSGTCIDLLNNTQLNLTSNNTLLEPEEQLADLILMGILSILLGLMILVTIIGK